jgi:hypothetical protein
MSDERIQLIFCVESTKKAAIDSKYINEVLKHYYNVGENRISYVFMCGKFNYIKPKTLNEIQQYMKDYQVTGTGKSHVIYVFDKDLNAQDYIDTQFEKAVKKYCQDNKFQLIWFVKTIEDVMWGSTINKKEKSKKALQFISRHQIEKVEKSNLEAHANVNKLHKSNILTVLNKFSQIKK